MKYTGKDMEQQATMATTASMCAAARTAPKAHGKDTIYTYVLTGEDLEILADGYGKVYKLTSSGEESLKTAQTLWDSAQRKIESFLGKEDADTLLRISRKNQNLEIS